MIEIDDIYSARCFSLRKISRADIFEKFTVRKYKAYASVDRKAKNAKLRKSERVSAGSSRMAPFLFVSRDWSHI